MEDGVNSAGQFSPDESANSLALRLIAFETAHETWKRADDRRREIRALGEIVKQKSDVASAKWNERNRCKSDAEREPYPSVTDIPEQATIEQINKDFETALNEVSIQRASLLSHPALTDRHEQMEEWTAEDLIRWVSTTEWALKIRGRAKKDAALAEHGELLGSPGEAAANVPTVSTAVAASNSPRIDGIAPKRHGGRRGGPEVAALRRKVQLIYREMKDSKLGLPHKDLCDRLDVQKIRLPPGASWKNLNSWVKAYQSNRQAVSRWISTALRNPD